MFRALLGYKKKNTAQRLQVCNNTSQVAHDASDCWEGGVKTEEKQEMTDGSSSIIFLPRRKN